MLNTNENGADVRLHTVYLELILANTLYELGLSLRNALVNLLYIVGEYSKDSQHDGGLNRDQRAEYPKECATWYVLYLNTLCHTYTFYHARWY